MPSPLCTLLQAPAQARSSFAWCTWLASLGCVLGSWPVLAAGPDLILHHGQIVTVDREFSIQQALAITGERIVAVGTNDDILQLAQPETQVIDLAGRMVLPGLIDSHVHATGAAVYEFDHPLPDFETIADVLDYVAARARLLPAGEWIVLQQVFVTRLRDQRFPTRQELDRVAPEHPVMFRTGPDAAVNSLALQLNGIDRDYEISDGEPGYLERDPATGELNGILRSCTRIIKYKDPLAAPTFEQRQQRLKELFADYNRVGITSVCDRSMGDDALRLYDTLAAQGELTCRVFGSYSVNAQAPLSEIEARLAKAVQHPRHTYNNQVWLRGVKIFLDGGMLTGSAYMSRPWGVSSIYSITDPEYRGLLYVDAEKLYQLARLSLANNLQFTAHAVGDGAIAALLAAYARIDRDDFSVREKRPCLTHANFMSAEIIGEMHRLGVVADLQPAWLWLDGKTLLQHFGEERTRYFQPYKTLFERGVIVGGGSDHMQKIGPVRSVNPYHPFLGMWTTLTRAPRWTEETFHAQEIISREQALRLYTINNAYLTFEEQEKGSLEVGKLADLIVIDRDLLTCPVEEVRQVQVLQTYLGGKRVFDRTTPPNAAQN